MKGERAGPRRLGGDLTNPQSLNRYAYVLNNPTTFIDPLGLQERSTIANGCEDPHVLWHEPGLIFPNGNCSLDQISINCGALFRAIQAGITNVQPISVSGNTITAPTIQCQYLNEANPAVCSAGVATFTLGSVDSTPSWWGTFAKSFVQNFSLKSARQPGESVLGCAARAENALLGNKGALILNSAAIVSPAVIANTASLVKAPIGVEEAEGETATVSVLEFLTGGARVAQTASSILSGASAVATGLALGFLGACY